ncbi:MAG: glycosyltransferase family 39 protein [bacterium]|nr:glycosyltransferase family 39 protein [bacterium]
MIVTVAFALRFLLILPHGNGIVVPYRDQNTYYSLARALVDDGYLGVPREPRGPYLEHRAKNLRSIGFYPAFHDSMSAVWDEQGFLYGMVEWGKPNSFFEPLYPLFTAGMYLVFRNNFFFWRLINVFLGTLLVFLVYDVGKRAFRDYRVGTIAAVYVCFYPHFLFYTWILMAESLLLTLLGCGFWAYYRYLETPRWSWAALIGVFFGAFVLTRSFLIAFFPFIILFMLIFTRHRRRWSYAALSILTFVVVMAPWVYRNYQLHGRFVLLSTRGGYNIWMRNNPYFIADELKAMGVEFSPETVDKLHYREYILGYPNFTTDQGELERNDILTREGLKFIKANPGFFLEMCWIRFKWTIGYKGIGLKGPLMNGISLLSYGPVLLGFLLSFIWGWRRFAAMLPLWAVVGYFVFFYSLTHEGLRYRLPVDPYMILLSAFSALAIYKLVAVPKPVPIEIEHAGLQS